MTTNKHSSQFVPFALSCLHSSRINGASALILQLTSFFFCKNSEDWWEDRVREKETSLLHEYMWSPPPWYGDDRTTEIPERKNNAEV